MKDSGGGSRSLEPSEALALGKERMKGGRLAQRTLCLPGSRDLWNRPWVSHRAGRVLGLLCSSVIGWKLPGRSGTLIQMLG